MNRTSNGHRHCGRGGSATLLVAALMAGAAMPLAATDLPWVFDSSARTMPDGGLSVTVPLDNGLETMVGHWSRATNSSRLRTVSWGATYLIIR